MYQPNVSQLHRNAQFGSPVSAVTAKFGTPVAKTRPPLPTTKPPIRPASHIPTKMNLDNSVVNKFLQAMGEKTGTENGPSNGLAPINEHTTSQTMHQTSHLWKQPERTIADGPASTRATATNGNTSPKKALPWMKTSSSSSSEEESQKSPPWVNKANDPSKPKWNAKALEKTKPVWCPNSTTNGSTVKETNGNTATTNIRSAVTTIGTALVNVRPVASTNGSSVKEPVANGSSVKESATNSCLRPASTTNSSLAQNRVTGTDWRSRYEEAEKRRKELLSETQKAAREKATLERRLLSLETEHKQLKAEHKEQSGQLNKLSQVSEKVYQDYDNLNNKYEVETSALHRALGAASKWYTENKKLRRASIAIRSNQEPSPLDETDGDDHELDELRKTVHDLSTQVGQLQSELNRAKLQEFEAQEQYTILSQQLDHERQTSQKQMKELKELRLMREKFESVTCLVQGEVESLRQQKDNALEQVRRLQGETNEAKKERNVLAHQSSLLMGDIGPEDRLMRVMMEVEDLKRKLEENEHRHAMQIQEIQESLEERESDSHVELLEEKLKLAESELQVALERAETAEKELESKASSPQASSAPSPPCPPPPPPPPPMPPMMGGINAPLKKLHPTEGSSLDDMAKLLGIQRSPKPAAPQGVAVELQDSLLNELKSGKFTLRKPSEKVTAKKEEQPAAVQEMLGIIGTLKHRRQNKRPINT